MKLTQAINHIQKFTGKFPQEEVTIIRENREQAIPLLLDAFKSAIEINDCDYVMGFLHILFLLSEFEVHEACDMMIELLTEDEFTISFFIGDALADNYAVMLANVMQYDDIPKIINIVNDRGCYIFARICALNTLLALTAAGKLDYKELGTIYESLIEINFNDEDIAWCFADYSEYICTPNMRKLIDKQFCDGIIDTYNASRIVFSIKCMEKDKKSKLFNNEFLDKKYGVIDILKTWNCYMTDEDRNIHLAWCKALEKAGLSSIFLNSSVKRKLDDSLLDTSGLFVRFIGRKYGYDNIDLMTADKAVRIVHDVIIDKLYDTLLSCNKDSYELFMKCYNHDIVTLSCLSSTVTNMFELGILFCVINNDYSVSCYITDDVKCAANAIFKNNDLKKLRNDKLYTTCQ